MKSLNTNKASHSSDIPTKILKQNVDFFTPFILGYVNKSISSSTFAALFMDLSKAFDCLPHDQIIAKLHVYGFDKASLGPMHSYLTDRSQNK